ncbi:MAG: DUF3006 domain-containing protein [Thermoleophilia bacterium]
MESRFNCYLDRIEGDSAVLLIEGRESVVPVSVLPRGAREGDHLQLAVIVDESARDKTASEISDLQRRLKLQDGQE